MEASAVSTVVPEPVADRSSEKRKLFNIPILKGRVTSPSAIGRNTIPAHRRFSS